MPGFGVTGFGVVVRFAGDEENPVDPVTVHLEDLRVPGPVFLPGAGRQDDLVPDVRDAAQFGEEQARQSFVVSLGGLVAGQLGEFVGAEQTRARPADALRVRVEFRFVVLVADIADDFFDEILHGDQAGGAAVFVDDQRDLHAVGADPFHHGVPVETGGHVRNPAGQGVDRRGGPCGGRDGERVFDVDDTEGVVEVAVDHREPGVAGAVGAVDQVEDGVVAVQRLDGHARSHQIGGGALTELQGPVDELGGALVQDAADGGRADQRAQFLRRPRRAQFVGGFDAQAPDDVVGAAVEPVDGPLEHEGEPGLQACGGAGGRQGPRDGEVLGDEFAEDHRERGRQDQRDDQRHGAGRGLAQPDRGEQRVEEAREDRFGEVAGDEGGDGDAELCPGELERQGAVCVLHLPGAQVAVSRFGVDGAAFEGGEGEFGRDEERGSGGQGDEADQAEDGQDHGSHIRSRGR